MHRLSELLVRNSDRFSHDTLVLINPPRDDGFRQLGSTERAVKLFTQDYGDYRWFRSRGADCSFGVVPRMDIADADCVLIQPREKQRLDMILHALSQTQPVFGSVWLAGELRTGIKSVNKNLGRFFESVAKVDNARHCVLYRAGSPAVSEPFSISAYVKGWKLEPPFPELELKSLPGVFAHGKLDAGTRLLLTCLSEVTVSGSVLDFACGCGVIGLTVLAMQTDANVWFLDSSALALESTRLSGLAAGRQLELLPSDGLESVEATFDWIITNPPFHRGIANDLDIAREFFHKAGNHLSKTGKLMLVYNNHLPYLAWLQEQFRSVEIVGSSAGFNVILAHGYRVRT